MGNALSPCCYPNSNSSVKLIFWEGTTRIITGKRVVAGEIMFEFPDRMVCHADSFFIGDPIPALAIDDDLVAGQTYFVLPLDCFACNNVLSASSLAALGSSSSSSSSSSPNRASINFKGSPFQHIKRSNGRALIKVMPEFITELIQRGKGLSEESSASPCNGFLCSTPELKKQYDQLVRSRDQVWSPKLETISEYKIRFSPCRFMGLEWKQKEAES